MSHEPSPNAVQVGRATGWGARPQPLNPVANPMALVCPACQQSLVEHIGKVERLDYAYVDNFDPPGYYHRSCIQQIMEQYTREVKEQFGNEDSR